MCEGGREREGRREGKERENERERGAGSPLRAGPGPRFLPPLSAAAGRPEQPLRPHPLDGLGPARPGLDWHGPPRPAPAGWGSADAARRNGRRGRRGGGRLVGLRRRGARARRAIRAGPGLCRAGSRVSDSEPGPGAVTRTPADHRPQRRAGRPRRRVRGPGQGVVAGVQRARVAVGPVSAWRLSPSRRRRTCTWDRLVCVRPEGPSGPAAPRVILRVRACRRRRRGLRVIRALTQAAVRPPRVAPDLGWPSLAPRRRARIPGCVSPA